MLFLQNVVSLGEKCLRWFPCSKSNISPLHRKEKREIKAKAELNPAWAAPRSGDFPSHQSFCSGISLKLWCLFGFWEDQKEEEWKEEHKRHKDCFKLKSVTQTSYIQSVFNLFPLCVQCWVLAVYYEQIKPPHTPPRRASKTAPTLKWTQDKVSLWELWEGPMLCATTSSYSNTEGLRLKHTCSRRFSMCRLWHCLITDNTVKRNIWFNEPGLKSGFVLWWILTHIKNIQIVWVEYKLKWFCLLSSFGAALLPFESMDRIISNDQNFNMSPFIYCTLGFVEVDLWLKRNSPVILT